MRRWLALISVTGALAAAPAVHAAGNPQIAGLQVALRAHGLYLAQIDGISGPSTGLVSGPGVPGGAGCPGVAGAGAPGVAGTGWPVAGVSAASS